MLETGDAISIMIVRAPSVDGQLLDHLLLGTAAYWWSCISGPLSRPSSGERGSEEDDRRLATALLTLSLPRRGARAASLEEPHAFHVRQSQVHLAVTDAQAARFGGEMDEERLAEQQ